MRIDYLETDHRKTGRAPSGRNASTIWTLTGVALLAACAHDGSSFLESGGGDTGASGAGAGAGTAASSTTLGVLAAIAAVGIGASSGGSSSGGGGSASGGASGVDTVPQLAAAQAITYADGHQANQRFDAQKGEFSVANPDGDELTYSVEGHVTGSEADAEDISQAGYNRRVAGQYGDLYYNNRLGSYSYVPENGKIDELGEEDTGTDTFTATASDGKRDSSNSVDLTVTVRGAAETANSPGTLALSNSDRAPAVGETLTATLADANGVPSNVTFVFFVADDEDGNNIEFIDSMDVTKTTDTTATLTVAAEHLGRYLGVTVDYTDEDGYDDGPEEYTHAAVVAAGGGNNGPIAVFSAAEPRYNEPLTVTVRDPDGFASSMSGLPVAYTARDDSVITYAFFYDNDKNPDNGTTAITAGVTGNTVAMSSTYADNYIGVTVTYTDQDGTAESETFYTEETVNGTARSTQAPTPYAEAPTLGRMYHQKNMNWDVFNKYDRHHSHEKWLAFGDRDSADPNYSLDVHYQHAWARNVLPAWQGGDIPQTNQNLLTAKTGAAFDTINGRYGYFHIARKDVDGTRPGQDEEGTIAWRYQPRATQDHNVHANGIHHSQTWFDVLFLQVFDDEGNASRVERLLVQIVGVRRDKHEPWSHDPTVGNEAPTLTTDNFQQWKTEMAFHERDVGSKPHYQELVYGDRDMLDGNHTLTINYHIVDDTNPNAMPEWNPAWGDIPSTRELDQGQNILASRYATWHIWRNDDEHPPASTNIDHEGSIHWTVRLGTASWMQRSVEELNDGEIGYDAVFLQVSDDEGAKSQIIKLQIEIEGQSSAGASQASEASSASKASSAGDQPQEQFGSLSDTATTSDADIPAPDPDII